MSDNWKSGREASEYVFNQPNRAAHLYTLLQRTGRERRKPEPGEARVGSWHVDDLDACIEVKHDRVGRPTKG